MAQLVIECAQLPMDAILVPLPTISRHVRERGFDHTRLLVKNIARLNGLRWQQILRRVNNATQVGAGEQERRIQAKTAYTAIKNIDSNSHYILVDDVWTTGSSMLEAAKRLTDRGVIKISTIVIAKSG